MAGGPALRHLNLFRNSADSIVVDLLVQPRPDICERARRGLGNLPPFSPVLAKLTASLASEDASFSSIASLIERDAVLAGNVLRLVNSALYGRRATVNSVRHAISLIGTVRLRNFVLSLSLNRMWQRVSVASHWSHAQFTLHGVATAVLADLLAQHLECDYPEGAFAAGLLLNIGSLLIAVSLPEECEQVLAMYLEGLQRGQQRSVEECEIAILGADHSEFSALALEHWNLPLPIRKAVATHTRCMREEGPQISLAWLLRVSENLAVQQGVPLQSWVQTTGGDGIAVLQSVGLGEQSERILNSFETEFEAIRQFFQ